MPGPQASGGHSSPVLRGGGGWPGLKWPQDGGEGLRGASQVSHPVASSRLCRAGQVPKHGSHGPEASPRLLAALLPPLQRRAFQAPGACGGARAGMAPAGCSDQGGALAHACRLILTAAPNTPCTPSGGLGAGG